MIYITGDIHGEVFHEAAAVERFGITNEDTIVILGDVGRNYYGNNHKKKKLNKMGAPLDIFQAEWEYECASAV